MPHASLQGTDFRSDAAMLHKRLTSWTWRWCRDYRGACSAGDLLVGLHRDRRGEGAHKRNDCKDDEPESRLRDDAAPQASNRRG